MTARAAPAPVLIMVAPTGARRTKADHPALPISPAEIAADAASCFEAGASALHLHVRDEMNAHSLDPARYREAIAAVRDAAPEMVVQITTEAAGRFSPADQHALVDDLKPASASIALRELFPESQIGRKESLAFVRRGIEAGVALQWILFDSTDLARLRLLVADGRLGSAPPRLLFVLGRYSENQESNPNDLRPFLNGLNRWPGKKPSWSVCAFGRGETAALAGAMVFGGHARVGFENSVVRADGSAAASNAQRVGDIAGLAGALGRPVADPGTARAILGVTSGG